MVNETLNRVLEALKQGLELQNLRLTDDQSFMYITDDYTKEYRYQDGHWYTVGFSDDDDWFTVVRHLPAIPADFDENIRALNLLVRGI